MRMLFASQRDWNLSIGAARPCKRLTRMVAVFSSLRHPVYPECALHQKQTFNHLCANASNGSIVLKKSKNNGDQLSVRNEKVQSLSSYFTPVVTSDSVRTDHYLYDPLPVLTS